jgi:antitoxin component YwqK of YwqJK toxin-antitoxin module
MSMIRKTALALPSAVWLMFAAIAPAHAVQDCDIAGVAVNPANGATTAGKTGIMRCRDRDTGELMREHELRNGVYQGIVRYYEKGKLAKEYSVNEKGNQHGLAREFSPDGTVLSQVHYDNGNLLGLARYFYPDGQLRGVSYSDAGKGVLASADFTARGQLSDLRCGDRPLLVPDVDDARLCGFAGEPSQVELIGNKGLLRSRLSYLAGKPVRSEDFYANGTPSAQTERADGRLTERRFSSAGVKRAETVSLLFERGSIKQREQEFSEGGQLVRDRQWNAAGDPLSDESFYLNGQARRKTVYGASDAQGGKSFSDITEFHDNGQRARAGRYLNAERYRQIPIGAHQYFDDQGRLIAESVYDDAGRLTRERAWDANGQLEHDEQVFEDGSRKRFMREAGE